MGDSFFYMFCAIQRPAMRLKSVLISLVLAYNDCLGEFSYTARKCCPQDHSLNAGLECVPSTHHWHYLNVTTTGLPNCRFTVEFAEEGVSAYCFDNSFETASYLMVKSKCEGSSSTGPGRRVPPMNYVRKCCQFNRSYDTSWQSCWGPESRDTGRPSAFFNILMSRSSGGVDVNYGMEMCDEKQVLVDFVLHYTQVLRDESEAIVLSVPGRPEMRFNPDDVCLDLTESSDTVVIRACLTAEGVCSPKGDRPCVKKCCPDGYSVVEGNCAKTNVALPKLEFFHRPDNVVSSLREPGFSFGSLCGFNSSVLQGENLSLNLHGVLTDGRHFYRDFCVDHSVKVSPYAYYMTCLDVTTFHDSACMITCPTIVFSTSITSCVLLFLSPICWIYIPYDFARNQNESGGVSQFQQNIR
ncbi:uncharacterized protein LOC112126941 [Cimex lectularius]|uniref:Uncharacterized protein n=1 Tax=Cimex lectularius TaxID=79782 RepID=A0A8I6SKG3_CIMLE|nr:uncharacterized protein LOC112126941 [Cimex lectularius]